MKGAPSLRGGPPCKVCSHDQRDDIENQLFAGKPAGRVGKAFEVSEDAVSRHRKNCIPELVAKSRYAAEIKRADFIVDQVDKLLKSCRAVLDRAERRHEDTRNHLLIGVPKAKHDVVIAAAETMAASDEMVLKAAREIRPTLEFLARLIGNLHEGVSINIHLAPDFAELKAAILDGLKGHPEAFLDVKDALLEFMARRQGDGGDIQPLH